MKELEELKKDLRRYQKPEKAKILGRFFKTGPGEYAEGDVFLGLKTADTRSVAKKYSELCLSDISKLLGSKIHEHRTTAVMILNRRFEKGDFKEKQKIYKFYLKNISGIIVVPLPLLSFILMHGTFVPGPLCPFLSRINLARRAVPLPMLRCF